MQKSLAAHLTAIRSGFVTKSNVIGIRKAINLMERKAGGWSVPSTAPDPDDVFPIEEALSINAPIVTGELHDAGLKLLRDPRYAKVFDADQRCVIESAGAFFMLVGFDRIGRSGAYGVPVYRIQDDQGRSFRFRHIPWQSGGKGPEVVTWEV